LPGKTYGREGSNQLLEENGGKLFYWISVTYDPSVGQAIQFDSSEPAEFAAVAFLVRNRAKAVQFTLRTTKLLLKVLIHAGAQECLTDLCKKVMICKISYKR
jgi:hypothetical protein